MEKMKNWELEKKETFELNDNWFEDKYTFKPKDDDHFKIRLYISPNGIQKQDILGNKYYISISDIEDINNFVQNTILKYQK